MPRNPKWHRDELILTLDLYFDFGGTLPNQNHPNVVELSHILNNLPIFTERPDPETFRNANGVYMKLCNFLRFDPNYDGVGLTRGGKLEKEVWDVYFDNQEELKAVANSIKSIVDSDKLCTALAPVEIDDDEEAKEGNVLLKLHKYRERNSNLVKRKKKAEMERKKKLECEVCNFDFFRCYGDIGKGFIECHHKKPVHMLKPNEKTRISDLALVCANCHRMLHRNKQGITIEALVDMF
ncbi:HNH endonuclease [Thermodesulfobacteriota bacterium]